MPPGCPCFSANTAGSEGGRYGVDGAARSLERFVALAKGHAER